MKRKRCDSIEANPTNFEPTTCSQENFSDGMHRRKRLCRWDEQVQHNWESPLLEDKLNEHGEKPARIHGETLDSSSFLNNMRKRKRKDVGFEQHHKKRKIIDYNAQPELSPPYINSEDENFSSSQRFRGSGEWNPHPHTSFKNQLLQYNEMQEQRWQRQQQRRQHQPQDFDFIRGRSPAHLDQQQYSHLNRMLHSLHQERLTREPPILPPPPPPLHPEGDDPLESSRDADEPTPWFMVPYENERKTSVARRFSISTHAPERQPQQHEQSVAPKTISWPQTRLVSYATDALPTWDPFALIPE